MSPGLVVILIVCLGVSFMMSGMEAGVFALNRLRVRQMRRAGDRRAQLLVRYFDQPEGFLWTILVGNTVANFAAAALMLYQVHLWLGDRPAFYLPALIVAFLGFYAFCDLLPKLLFRKFPTRLCLNLAAPFLLFHVWLRPLVVIATTVAEGLLRWTGGQAYTGKLFGNREELRLLMQQTNSDLTSDERQMIQRVLDLQNVPVRQIMVPIEKAVTVTDQTPMGEVLKLWRERAISRLPVWREEAGRRSVIGLVSLKTVLYHSAIDPARPVAEFVRPALYLDAGLRLENAMQRLQRSGQRLAIVLSSEGREVGVISLQDILRFMFGEVTL
jgi:CBS domain containing-hemolysin-like protein